MNILTVGSDSNSGQVDQFCLFYTSLTGFCSWFMGHPSHADSITRWCWPSTANCILAATIRVASLVRDSFGRHVVLTSLIGLGDTAPSVVRVLVLLVCFWLTALMSQAGMSIVSGLLGIPLGSIAAGTGLWS